MNRIDRHRSEQSGPAEAEAAMFWRHPRFPEMELLKARFRRHRYDLHTHPTYVIALVTGGCERVRVGRRREDVPSGTVLVVNPEEVHDGEAGCADGWTYRTFYPSVGLMTDVARELGISGAPLFWPAGLRDPLLARLLAEAHRAAEQPDAVCAEETMLLALRRLMLGHARAGGDAQPMGPAGAARRLGVYRAMVEDDPAGRFALEDFAGATGVTRFQVIRDFRLGTGLTPGAYVRDRRVRLASRLVADGVGLAEAALAAGFADQSHFGRAFKLARGFTPGALQRGSGG